MSQSSPCERFLHCNCQKNECLLSHAHSDHTICKLTVYFVWSGGTYCLSTAAARSNHRFSTNFPHDFISSQIDWFDFPPPRRNRARSIFFSEWLAVPSYSIKQKNMIYFFFRYCAIQRLQKHYSINSSKQEFLNSFSAQVSVCVCVCLPCLCVLEISRSDITVLHVCMLYSTFLPLFFILLFLQILQGASHHHLTSQWRCRRLETAHTIYMVDMYNEVIFHGIQVSDNDY